MCQARCRCGQNSVGISFPSPSRAISLASAWSSHLAARSLTLHLACNKPVAVGFRLAMRRRSAMMRQRHARVMPAWRSIPTKDFSSEPHVEACVHGVIRNAGAQLSRISQAQIGGGATLIANSASITAVSRPIGTPPTVKADPVVKRKRSGHADIAACMTPADLAGQLHGRTCIQRCRRSPTPMVEKSVLLKSAPEVSAAAPPVSRKPPRIQTDIGKICKRGHRRAGSQLEIVGDLARNLASARKIAAAQRVGKTSKGCSTRG